MKKTKIVCTLGPSSSNKETLLQMVANGMNVGRLNFSHADYAIHQKNIELIREINVITQKNIGILIDTKGPEIRTHNFEGGFVSFERGDIVHITGTEILGNKQCFSVSYGNIYEDIEIGQKILVDDGCLEFAVIEKEESQKKLVCQTINAHVIKDKRGVNIPGAHIQLDFISEKDRKDIEFCCDQDVDFIAVSFVQTVEDVCQIKEILEKKGKLERIKIIAKIETVKAVENILDILEASDGIMVARGDLGVEVASYDVPVIQKQVIKACQSRGKVSITATQMLESMQNNPRPTRAEVSDVANAVLDGSDAVMLSGETAAGMYPVESVRIMASVCERIEGEANYPKFIENALSHKDHENLLPYTIANAVCESSHHLGAKGIITPSKSGMTPRLVSKFRPHPPIVAITEDPKVATTLSLHYGVYVILDHFAPDYRILVEQCRQVAKGYLGLEVGDRVILSAGLPIGKSGTTNEMRILTIH